MKVALRFIQYVGVALMIHAIASAAQRRGEVEVGEDADVVSGDILFEALVAFLLACYGFIALNAHFEPIHRRSALEDKTPDHFHFRPSFMVFQHRKGYEAAEQ
eukprot:TRINITY_DN14396_c0_g1_i1.p3 TRINITY_DN14396_c0_g1~~TRINITY_DN14396_c0_g1_i1.p3  ORF type:complete len:103 (-),score=52.60 TRINITY_DN14396_c0_g1_i1:171-479(-)